MISEIIGNCTLCQGNALSVLQGLQGESVQCIVTSPPYWGLRSYGTSPQVWRNGKEPCQEHRWEERTERTDETGYQRNRKGLNHAALVSDGNERTAEARVNNVVKKSDTCSVCGAWRGELGLEPTPELYVEHLTQIFHEARRVLRSDGVMFLNLGDSYWGGKGQSGVSDPEEQAKRNKDGDSLNKSYHQTGGDGKMRPQDGKHPVIKPKDLVGIPWRVAFALQADGWYLRQDIIWAKPNPMPESVRDRCTKAHEYIFLLSKSPRYYYDADAVAEESVHPGVTHRAKNRGKAHSGEIGLDTRPKVDWTTPEKRNKRSVWTISTQSFREAHFATFPEKLIEPMVLAGCPVGGTVLDPFGGSGTTGAVCERLGRKAILIDLNPNYIEMQKRRVGKAHKEYNVPMELA